MHTSFTVFAALRWPVLSTSAANCMRWVIAETNQAGSGKESLAAVLQRNQSTASADHIATQPQAGEMTLFLPAESALLTRVFVPSSKPGHIRAAVPHLIEEGTVADAETLHLVTGLSTGDGVPVIAIDRALLSHVIADVETASCTCSRIYVDALLLPHREGTLTLLVDGDRVLLRWSAAHAGAVDSDSIVVFLSALFQQQSISAIDFYTTSETTPDQTAAVEHQVAALSKVHPVSVNSQPLGFSLLPYLANQVRAVTDEPLNLRQGEFVLKNPRLKVWRRWRPLALAAAVCLIAQIGLNLVVGWRLNQRAEAIHHQSEQLYRELFPQDKRIVNLHQQFQNHLNTGAQAGHFSFFSLFGQLTNEIQGMASENPLQLHSVLYDTAAGTLQVELTVPTIQTLDNLQKRLSKNPLRAKVLSATNNDGVVLGRLSLTGAAP